MSKFQRVRGLIETCKILRDLARVDEERIQGEAIQGNMNNVELGHTSAMISLDGGKPQGAKWPTPISILAAMISLKVIHRTCCTEREALAKCNKCELKKPGSHLEQWKDPNCKQLLIIEMAEYSKIGLFLITAKSQNGQKYFLFSLPTENLLQRDNLGPM